MGFKLKLTAKKMSKIIDESVKLSEASGLNWQHPWVLVQEKNGQRFILGTYDNKREATDDMKGLFYDTGPGQKVIPMTPEISSNLKKKFG